VTPPCPAAEVELSARQGGTAALLAGGARGLTAVCGYGIGMLHEAKVVRASADAGRSWRTVASWLLTGPDRSGLPGLSTMAVFAGPEGHIYMATVGELAFSTDGGQSWSPFDLVGKAKYLPGNGSYGDQFDFTDAEHGWLLLVGEALLSTRDGQRWSPLGPVSFG
jgi:photosystem II stability/assembly factor-like uncharacterized protein